MNNTLRKILNTKRKSALKFNSGTGVVTIPNAASFQGLTALTAEFYINLQAVSDASYARVFDYAAGNTGYAMYFNNLTQGLAATVGNGSTSQSPNFSTTLTIGLKTHVALVWDGSNVNCYFAGVKDSVHPALSGGNTGNPAMSFYFGNEAAIDRGGKIIIDEFRLSNNARYTADFKPPIGPLLVDVNTIELWKFDEGDGKVTSGAKGNLGTLSGSPLPLWVPGL